MAGFCARYASEHPLSVSSIMLSVRRMAPLPLKINGGSSPAACHSGALCRRIEINQSKAQKLRLPRTVFWGRELLENIRLRGAIDVSHLQTTVLTGASSTLLTLIKNVPIRPRGVCGNPRGRSTKRMLETRLAARPATRDGYERMKRAAAYEGMTPQELTRVLRATYGKLGWQAQAARDMLMSRRGIF